MSNSLWPHGLQYARLPCPSPTLGACSNSCPLSRWCHPTISTYATLFPFASFPVSQFFESGGQSIGASASVFPMNIQGWFPLGWTGFISLQSKELSEVFPAPQFDSINSSVLSLLYIHNIKWQRTPVLPVWLGEKLGTKSEHMHCLTAPEPTPLPYLAPLEWIRCMLLPTWHNRSTWPSVNYFSPIKKEHLKLLKSLYLPNGKKFHPVLNDTKLNDTNMMKSVKGEICTISKQVP